VLAGPHQKVAKMFGYGDTVTKVAAFIQLEKRFLAEALKTKSTDEAAKYAEIQAVHMINKYFPNNANPNKVGKMAGDLPLIGNDFARTATEVTRNFLNAGDAIVKGKDGMQWRTMKTAMFLTAVGTAANLYAEHVNGVTPEERKAVFASLPDYLRNQPGLIAWPGQRPPMREGMEKPSDAGFYVIDVTNGFDFLRLFQGNPDDFAPARVVGNLLKTAFNPDGVDDVYGDPMAAAGAMSKPLDFNKDPNALEDTPSKLFKYAQGAGLVPGIVSAGMRVKKRLAAGRVETVDDPFVQPMGPVASVLSAALPIRAVGPRTQLAALREQVFKLKDNNKALAGLLSRNESLEAMRRMEESGDPRFLLDILKRYGDRTDEGIRRIVEVGNAMEVTK
jgi:hypothetical protein